MKTMKNILTAIIAMAFFTNECASKIISGKVEDAFGKKPLSGVSVELKYSLVRTKTDDKGKYSIEVNDNLAILVFSLENYGIQELPVGNRQVINVLLTKLYTELVETELLEIAEPMISKDDNIRGSRTMPVQKMEMKMLNEEVYISNNAVYDDHIQHNTEEYDLINENIFRTPFDEPLSTFSIDVDAASYSNIRRMINSGINPQKDMVRIEEMINYFTYDYPNPTGPHPFSITTEISNAPWNEKHQLVHIGLQGKMIDYNELKSSNLVFLIDVSGSMSSNNKLPLLISSMKLLVGNLSANDRVAIVVYAGAAGVVLPSTPVSEKQKIIDALSKLSAGGSTAGGAGIKLAYDIAEQNLIRSGNNRVILATDGDFNVGASSTAEMVRLIEDKRDLGIFLTITGFGMGNYKDGRMEQISNAGNGNYFYIDNIGEAKKVFVKEMRATLFTIAKDVKIQVEFNPTKVQAYRLIGYENRMLNAEDFNDDKKDAGELGAGHTVTALYEIIPVGIKSEFIKNIDPLKYQSNGENLIKASEEILTVKFRYKKPKEDKSKLIVHTLSNKVLEPNETSDNFRFSAAVAQFGMLLRDSEFKSNSNYNSVLELATSAKGKDPEGYRFEFIRMVDSSKLMAVK